MSQGCQTATLFRGVGGYEKVPRTFENSEDARTAVGGLLIRGFRGLAVLPETHGLHDLSNDRAQDNQADADPEQRPVTKNDRKGAEGESERNDDDGRPRGRRRTVRVMIGRDVVPRSGGRRTGAHRC